MISVGGCVTQHACHLSGSNASENSRACLQVVVDVKVVLLQQLLAPLCSCGGQLNVADGDLCARLDGLQCCENDALLAEALHGIWRAGVIDQGSC